MSAGPASGPLERGSEAPDFAFHEGGPAGAREARLRERAREQGAFVLFLPLAGAPVCTADVRALVAAAAKLGAPARPLVVVSVDRDAHLRRFLDELGGAQLGHHGDPTLEVAARFGVRRPEEFAARASFFVGRDGRVAGSAIHPIGFPRPIDALLEWAAAR